MLNQLKKDFEKLADKERAVHSQRFFKTGKGEYGEGDIFMGLTVPQTRTLAKKYSSLSLPKVQELLKSKIHEQRLAALLILIEKYKKANEREKENIFAFYLKNTKYVNNWDLVDLSAHKIVGDFIKDKPRKILYKLANSKDLWEKRISIIATFAFIDEGDFEDALVISEILLPDKHDLIHKAVGWVLREIGKKDPQVLEKFLKYHYKNLPRTTLRYAIERFPEEKRKKYLLGNI